MNVTSFTVTYAQLQKAKVEGINSDGLTRVQLKAPVHILTILDLYGIKLALTALGLDERNKTVLVKIAAAFARSTLHIFEARYPDDRRPRIAIEVAENTTTATDADAYAAARAARAAAHAAAYAARAATAATDAAANAAAHAVYAAARAAARAAAYAAAYAVYAAYAAYAAHAANAAANVANEARYVEEKKQFQIMYDILEER